MGELILGGKNNQLPAHLQNREINRDEWAVLGGPRVPTLEVTAEVIRAVIGDQVVSETENAVEIAVVGVSKVARVFYRSQYDKDAAPTLPDCYSADGIVPADNAQDPQSTSCDKCEQNVKGSSTGLAGSKACRYRQNLAVMMPAVPDKLFRLSISATGIFPPEKTRSGHLAFAPYGQQLIASNVTPDMVYTELKRDLSLGNIRSVFKATAYLDEDIYAQVQAWKNTPEYDQIIDMHMTSTNTATAGGGRPAIETTTRKEYVDDDLPAELRGSQSRQTRMDKAGVTEAKLSYVEDPSGETDPNDTYWICDHDDSVHFVPAGDPLPKFDTYQEITADRYDQEMKALKAYEAEQEEKRKQAEREAEAKRAEEERVKLAAAKAKAESNSARRRTAGATSNALPVGNDYIKDPGRFVDGNETYWVNNQVKGNVFSVPPETELPDGSKYTEIATREEAQKKFDEAVAEAQKQKETRSTQRRTAGETTTTQRRTAEAAVGADDKSHRRQHNRQPTNTEEPVHRSSTASTAGQTLANKVGQLGDD